MKKLTLTLCLLAAGASAIYAGPSRSFARDVQQVQHMQTSDFYRDHEMDVNVFGTYVFTGTEYRNDRYLGTDHAFGGGLDVKYFFTRYLGVGVEGYVLDAQDVNRGNSITGFTGFDDRQRRAVGAALGTITFRYPFPGTGFAPYAWLGGGAVFGGGRSTETIVDVNSGSSFRQDVSASNTELVGQFGGGIEYRFTPRIGITSDFSWNVVNGSRNNFGMARTGLNFAF